ncbi:MAG: GAF domain-containing protein [Chloroflexota bacterium]
MTNDSSQPQTTGQQRLRQLTKQVDDLAQLLRTQREMLKQRGMNLPSGSLDNLRTLKARIDGLTRQYTNTMIELQRLRALAETTALINSALETNVVLNQVMDTVINLTGAERGYIVLKNRRTAEFDQFRVARGIDQGMLTDPGDEPDGKRSEFIVSRTIVNEVAETGEAVLTDNASQDDRYRGQQSIVGFALRSILAVPLKVRDEVIGVVYCDNRILAGLFQESDLDMLKAFSHQAAVAIENARLFEEMRRQLAQITEMRDLMDNVFDSIANGVLTLNGEGIVTTCNAAAAGILGLNSHDEAVDQHFADLMPPMDESFITVLEQVADDGQQRLIEVNPDFGGGNTRIWNVIVSSLRDEQGGSQGLALVLDDLTEKRRREAQLAELRRYLPGALVDNIQHIDEINIVGQERVITMIATDVRGFTSFSERLPPEKLMEIINRYLSLASDGINLYEGIVDKYMGDAVTGLFNTQLNPQDDHPIRAVRAALSIMYDLYALHEVMPEDQRLFYGIGIHTGSAYLGNVGSPDRQEFSALGEAATVAKFLESSAQAGEIIISKATYEHVKEFFDCESREPDRAKAPAGIEVIYRVIKRKKGINTGQLFLDPELAELLANLNTDTDG